MPFDLGIQHFNFPQVRPRPLVFPDCASGSVLCYKSVKLFIFYHFVDSNKTMQAGWEWPVCLTSGPHQLLTIRYSPTAIAAGMMIHIITNVILFARVICQLFPCFFLVIVMI
jgi:hypothetical protein